MLAFDTPVALLVAAAGKVCAGCRQTVPLSDFTPDAHRHDRLHRLCRPCRAERAAAQRAQRSLQRAQQPDEAAPGAPGYGPSRIEPGAILLALEELQAAPTLVCLSVVDVEALPRGLRPLAVLGVDGVPVIPRAVLVDWCLAQRQRVGEYAMASIGTGDLTRQQADSKKMADAFGDRSRESTDGPR